jgi:hypothetical protein
MRALIPALSLLAACSTADAVGGSSLPRTWRFATGPAADVELANVSGPVTVRAAPGSEVQVEAVVRDGSEAERASWLVEAEGTGPAVRVRARCEEGKSCSRAHVVLTVKAPPASRLAVRAVSGDIDVAGITGDLRVESTSGDVKVSGAGALSVRSVSGDVTADGAASATIDSVSGDLTLQKIQGESKLHTVSGDVRWTGPCAAGCRLASETVSGDLHLRLAPASAFELDFQTRSGDVEDTLGGATSKREGRNAFHIRVGDGAGAISVRSVSGDLRLERN